MAKRSKRTKSTAKSKRKTSGRKRFVPELSSLPRLRIGVGGRNLRIASWGVGVAAVVLGSWLGVPRLRAAVSEAQWADSVAIEFADAPVWVEDDLRDKLILTARAQLSGDPLAGDELMLVHRALLNEGWFESIEQVRRVAADRVRVEATWVKPFALVRDDEGDHLIDPYGTLLPRTFPHDGAAAAWIVITGPRYDRPQRPGAQWDGADIAAALRLLRLIDQQPWLGMVRSIDVSKYVPDGDLEMITDRGSRILWGSAPGDEEAGEAAPKRKLMYLQYQAEHYDHIDGGHAGLIDITSPTGVFAR
jgi:hypothetical protein